MGKTAILLGASGLTGSFLLQELLNSKSYNTIHCIGRTPLGVSHPKLKEHIHNLLELNFTTLNISADVVFCCIGTTQAKTPDKAVYRKIDYGIPVAAAKWTKAAEIGCFICMSSLGANANSAVFYSKTKGEMETEVLKLEIPRTYILRPSIILGKRNENRFGERIAKVFMTLISPLMRGSLHKYRPIHALTIAKGMLRLAESYLDSGIVESDVINTLSKEWE